MYIMERVVIEELGYSGTGFGGGIEEEENNELSYMMKY